MIAGDQRLRRHTRVFIQKTNDPRDLEPPQVGGGLNSNPEQQIFSTPGPYIPKQDLLQGVEQPKVRIVAEVRLHADRGLLNVES